LIHRDYLIMGSEIHIDIYDDRLEISSPGGMYSGKMIQEQDIELMKSERRNPNIADLFHRMRYMERRGSGLKKIVNETKTLSGYDEKFLPAFYSTVSSFTVVLKNVNYTGVKGDGRGADFGDRFGDNFGDRFGDKLSEIQIKILELMCKDETISAKSIAENIGITPRGVESNISALKKKGIIERTGTPKNGRWIVKEG